MIPRLLFLDLETTGLDPLQHCIIEVSARAIHPLEFTVERFHAYVRPNPAGVASMDDYVREMHTKSGLLERAQAEGKSAEEVGDALRVFAITHQREYLAGNSIHFDRSFLAIHMPDVLKRPISHRMLDVTSVRLALWMALGKDPLDFEKKRAHTSDDDLDETIKEFERYCVLLRTR